MVTLKLVMIVTLKAEMDAPLKVLLKMALFAMERIILSALLIVETKSEKTERNVTMETDKTSTDAQENVSSRPTLNARKRFQTNAISAVTDTSIQLRLVMTFQMME